MEAIPLIVLFGLIAIVAVLAPKPPRPSSGRMHFNGPPPDQDLWDEIAKAGRRPVSPAPPKKLPCA